MSDLVINEATCSFCGNAPEWCDCDIEINEAINELEDYDDDDRDDYLPLPGSTVAENKDDDSPDFMRRMLDHEEQERKANENNLRRIGLANNEGDLLIPPSITEILVNERQTELAGRATVNRQSRSPAGQYHSPEGLTYPML